MFSISRIWTFALVLIFAAGCDSGDSGGELDEGALLGLLLLGSSTASSGSIDDPNEDGCPESAAALPAGAAIADTVNSAPGSGSGSFSDPSLAVNAVCGVGADAGSTDVYQLDQTGSGAEIILEWSGRKVTDGTGIDFVVFENVFNNGGSSNSRFMEAIVVEVRDEISGNYCGFAPNYTNADETSYSSDPSVWANFAGLTPVLLNQVTNQLSADAIFDSSQAGGDGFDLADLSGDNTYSTGCSESERDAIQTEGFVYVRLIDSNRRNDPNTGNPFPWPTDSFDCASDYDGLLARYITAR